MAKWKKGESGGGRKPRGAIHQRTVFLNALRTLSSSEEEFAERLLEQAREGNATALQIATQRLWKLPKPQLDPFELPQGDTRADTAKHIVDAVADGNISADQGSVAMQVLRGAAEMTDIQELLARVEALEGTP